LVRIKEHLPGLKVPEAVERNPNSQAFSTLFNAFSKLPTNRKAEQADILHPAATRREMIGLKRRF